MQNRRRWPFAVPWVALALLVTVLPASADGDEPYPFLFLIRGEVPGDRMGEFSQLFTQVIEAHKQHENGNNWATYMPMTGDSSPLVRMYIPMDKIGEMDGWTPHAQIMTAAHGPEKAPELMQDTRCLSLSLGMDTSELVGAK